MHIIAIHNPVLCIPPARGRVENVNHAIHKTRNRRRDGDRSVEWSVWSATTASKIEVDHLQRWESRSTKRTDAYDNPQFHLGSDGRKRDYYRQNHYGHWEGDHPSPGVEIPIRVFDYRGRAIRESTLWGKMKKSPVRPKSLLNGPFGLSG